MRNFEVVKSEELFEKAKKGDRAKWAKQCIEDRAFKMSAQWSRENAEVLVIKKQLALSDNEILPAINLVVSQLTENSPRFTAVGIEESDNRAAGDIANLMHHIWTGSRGDTKLKRFVIDFEDIGMGALMLYIDPYADWGKGEIRIEEVDPLELYIDPNSTDPNCIDASYIMIVKKLTKERIKELYPDFDFTDTIVQPDDDYPTHNRYTGEDQVLRALDEETDKYRIIDRYTKVKIRKYHIFDRAGEYEEILDEEDFTEFLREPVVIITKLGYPDQVRMDDAGVRELMQLYQETGGVFHMMQDPMTGAIVKMPGTEHTGQGVLRRTTTKLSIVTKADLIDQGFLSVNKPLVNRIKRVLTIGGKLYRKPFIMPIENYPIVTAMLHHNRNPFPLGDIRLVKPLQEQLNKIDSLIMAYMQNITNVKFFMPRGSNTKDFKERAGNAGTEVFEYDAETGGIPVVVQLTQMSNSLYNHRIVLIQQIQRIIGSYSFQDGDMTQAPRTKGGTVLVDEMMQRRTSAKKFDIEQALNQLGTVVAEMIPHVYTERKIIRLLRPNHSPVEAIFNDKKVNPETGVEEIINDLTVMRYDIKLISGSMAPTNKMMRREELTNLYTGGVIKDPTPIIRELDLPNVDEILEREDAIRQAQQYIEQLETKIKELSGDLQTANREVVQTNQKIEVEKFKSKLGRVENEVEGEKIKAKLAIQNEVAKSKNKERSTNSNARSKK